MNTLLEASSPDTSTLALRRLTLDDTDMYFDVFDANRQHIAAHDPRLAQSFTTLSSVAEHLSPFNAKYRQHFGVMQDDEFVGSAALFLGRNQSAEISYWIDQAHTGQRLGAHASRLLINHASANVGVRQFEAFIAPTNVASIKTVQRLGFTHTKTLEEDVVYSLDLNQ